MALKNASYWTVEREEVLYHRRGIEVINGSTVNMVAATTIDHVNTYVWDTDGDRAMPAQQNPESLASPWRLENRGLRDNARAPRGEYVEIYRNPATGLTPAP